MDTRVPRPRKDLSADSLFAMIRNRFESVSDPRGGSPSISLGDALMSAFAMFSLKEPSLLDFDETHRDDANMRAIYRIGRVPSDTSMREILDGVEPEQLAPAFSDVFRCLQRGKVLESFVYWNDCYLVSLDGTQYFSSTKVHCPSCQEKHSRNGTVTYSHAVVGAVIVHPNHREVIPLCPEPIMRRDGLTKNDCERNATRRLLHRMRQEHPHLGLIVVEDGLASNGPHVRDLLAEGMHFILGAKPGDHPFLFEQVTAAAEAGVAHELETVDPQTGRRRSYLAVAGVPLNASHPDLLVNFVLCVEQKGDVSTTFSWITDLPVTPARQMLPLIARGGRARWKVENETFNTLKNQNYQFEHNYGHGLRNLSTVLMLLMMLAFLVDQTQQLACPLFQAVLKKLKRRCRLWQKMRSLFLAFELQTMAELYELILRGYRQPPFADTS